MLPLSTRADRDASIPATMSGTDGTLISPRCLSFAHRGVPAVCSWRMVPTSGRKINSTFPVSPCRFFATVSSIARAGGVAHRSCASVRNVELNVSDGML